MTPEGLKTARELEQRQKNRVDQVLVCPILTEHGRDTRVVLIEKKRPDWQVGLLNLPGGGVKSDQESPWNAAERELLEETGLKLQNMIHVGTLFPNEQLAVWLYAGRLSLDSALADCHLPGKTDEEPVWLEIHAALKHPKLVNDLRHLIPLCLSKLSGFVEAR